jgi:excisionase family DNA binding protein
MTAPRSSPSVPRLALTPNEAAIAIGVSRSHFFAAVLPELRVVRSGRCRLIPIAELERWLEHNAARAVVDVGTR